MYKINALRMLMTGKAKEYFDLREADHDPTNAAKTYEELQNKVKYYGRRRRLDSSANEKIQQGGDTMDVGAVGGWDRKNYDHDQDGVKAKARAKPRAEPQAPAEEPAAEPTEPRLRAMPKPKAGPKAKAEPKAKT